MSDSTQLSTIGLVKLYGSDRTTHAALRGINFSAKAGEFVAIRGPSGCGKSTLLHILGAMDRPTEGKVSLKDQRLDTLTTEQLAVVRRKQVGFIFQAFNLLPTLNVSENVSLPLLLDGVGEGVANERARAALADVGLEARSHHLPSQLSGGEMQRAAIARAVAIEPAVIIADEPTGSLDSANGQRVLEMLSRLNSEKGITVLMATHSEEAAAFASRVVFLKDGQLMKETESDVVSATV